MLATKVRGPMGPARTRSACRGSTSSRRLDASLKRLGTDYIDLYQIHRSDGLTNIEDTLRALDDPGARRQGPLHRLLEPARPGS